MKLVVVGPPPVEITAFLARRRALGQDPDGGYHRAQLSTVWVPTAAIVVEVVFPDDETWEKFDFYARHAVDEICIADPLTRQIRWFVLAGEAYEETGTSPLLGVTTADLVAGIDWPG